MSKKSKTKSSSTTNTSDSFNTVTTPTNPEWVTNSVQSFQDRINTLAGSDPSQYVTGPSALQQQAFASTPGVGLVGQGALSGASDVVKGMLASADPQAAQASARGLLDVDLEAYQNPYTDSVVNTTLAGFDVNADRTRAAQELEMAGSKKFGGSRSAITAAMTEADLARERAAAEAGLRSAGFDRATGLATTDLDRESQVSMFNAGQANQMTADNAARRLQSAGMLGDMGMAYNADQRANVGLLSDMGERERGIANEQAQAPLELAQLIAALNSSQPYDLFRGQTASGTSTGTETKTGTSSTTETDWMDTAAKAAKTAAIIFSDKRLKEDIKTVGRDRAGRRLVSYRYKGEPKDIERIGHIAQEVAKTDPHAVRKIGGRMAIDYGLLGDVA